ncbi:short-chain collagen C4-like [Halichondria panicea]|uniref:short-chain collagen C4-like n=1 Tax=Halichondria panicea TaxID=6063 RepID=UPI00312BC455
MSNYQLLIVCLSFLTLGDAVVYTRWGRTTCPGGTELVYTGRVGGTYYNQIGGGANYLCMPMTPDYVLPYQNGIRGHAYVYGAEYQYPIRGGHDLNVPCAVCRSSRVDIMMIPAKAYCPRGWIREYYGYLMTEARGGGSNVRGRTMFECVDKYPEAIPGSYGNQDGVLFHHVEASCNGMPCPPYDPNKELNCVVCTK